MTKHALDRKQVYINNLPKRQLKELDVNSTPVFRLKKISYDTIDQRKIQTLWSILKQIKFQNLGRKSYTQFIKKLARLISKTRQKQRSLYTIIDLWKNTDRLIDKLRKNFLLIQLIKNSHLLFKSARLCSKHRVEKGINIKKYIFSFYILQK